MGYLGREELHRMDFAFLGNDVKISDRASLDKTHLMSIGHRSRIDDFCAISGAVELGNNVFVAVHSSITASIDKIIFHDFSTVAFNCQVFSGSDDYSGNSLTNPTVPLEYKEIWSSAIEVGRHSILGASSIIFPGCKIAIGCAIGAGSVVTESTEPWGIYVGAPARRIKDRSKKLLALESRYLLDYPYEMKN
jgi:acetyltransferase-like isoleucine patch superfamily enzyme